MYRWGGAGGMVVGSDGDAGEGYGWIGRPIAARASTGGSPWENVAIRPQEYFKATKGMENNHRLQLELQGGKGIRVIGSQSQ